MPPRRIKLPLKRNAQARVPPRSNQGPSDDEEIAAKKAKGGEEAEEEASNARSGSGDRAGKKKNKHSRSVLPGEGGGLSARSIEFHRVKRELLSVVFVELALRGLQRRAQGSDEDASGMED